MWVLSQLYIFIYEMAGIPPFCQIFPGFKRENNEAGKLFYRYQGMRRMHMVICDHPLYGILTKMSFHWAIRSHDLNRRGFVATLQCAGAWVLTRRCLSD